MSVVTTRNKCNFSEYAVPAVIHAVQGDTGRRLIFEPEDYTIDGTETVSLFCVRPNGTAYSYAGTCDAETNTFTFWLVQGGGALTQAGVVAAQIVMTLTSGSTKSFKLGIIVEEALGGTASSQDVTFLQGLQSQLDRAIGNFVQSSLTVNGHALTGNIVLTPADIGAVPTTRTVNGKALSSNITLSASDVGAVPTTRTVNGKALSANITLAAADFAAGNVASLTYTTVSSW